MNNQYESANLGPNISGELMGTILPVVVPLFIAIICGIIVYQIVKAVSRRKKNNTQPQVTVEAVIVAKREEMRARGEHHNHWTTYYATFEMESGDRMELAVRPQDFGMLAEGDHGKLTFQGIRYLQFDRYLHPKSMTSE